MEPMSESANIIMDIDDEGEAEPQNIGGNRHDIIVLGMADSLLLDPPNCLEDKADDTILVD